jgi:hypothetical protein
MGLLRGRRAIPIVVAAVLCAAALAVGTVRYADSKPRADVVDGATTSGEWKTIEYEGVRVDIPAEWQRFDMDDCEFRFERWGAPGSDRCNGGSAVAFYGSATFDPAHRPGARRVEDSGGPGSWAGYAYAGEWAVYVSDADRDTVRQVLKSAR